MAGVELSEEKVAGVELSDESSAKLKKIVDSLEACTIMEVGVLLKTLEEKWGVSAAVVAAPSGGDDAGGGDAAEEKTSFTVTLNSAGSEKMKVIKLVREKTGLGLGESKALAESGGIIKQDIPKADAEEMKKAFENVGAAVELS